MINSKYARKMSAEAPAPAEDAKKAEAPAPAADKVEEQAPAEKVGVQSRYWILAAAPVRVCTVF